MAVSVLSAPKVAPFDGYKGPLFRDSVQPNDEFGVTVPAVYEQRERLI